MAWSWRDANARGFRARASLGDSTPARRLEKPRVGDARKNGGPNRTRAAQVCGEAGVDVPVSPMMIYLNKNE